MLITLKLGQEAQTRTIPGKLGYLIILCKMYVGQQDSQKIPGFSYKCSPNLTNLTTSESQGWL